MTGTINLTCWDCGTTWTMERSRGQYPRKCVDCRIARSEATRRVGRLRRAGAHAELRHDTDHGWHAHTLLPGVEYAVAVLDDEDLEFALADLQRKTA